MKAQLTSLLMATALLVGSGSTLWAQQTDPDKGGKSEVQQETKEIYYTHKDFGPEDQPASYPGGAMKLLQFLASSTNYPHEARERGSQGRVYIGFNVERDGSLTNFRVAKSVGDEDLDREALRVVKLMPKLFTPARKMIDGELKTVASYVEIPVLFKISQGRGQSRIIRF